MSMPPEPTAYRPCVGVMLINRDGLVWVGRRADMPGEPEGPGYWWQMPQGGIDADEEPQIAARRELFEETGIRSAETIGETAQWLTYDLPPDLIGTAWGGRYRGQKQKWFAMRFLGDDSEIEIAPPPPHQIEFDAWKWTRVDCLIEEIVPFKRAVYEAVVREFGPLAAPLED